MFLIKQPYASSGLKVTYNKTLEVYEGILNNRHFVATSKHTKKGKVWKEQKITTTNCFYQSVVATLANLSYHHSYSLVFSTFDEAYLAKCLLIERMRKDYLLAITQLQEKLNRNVPNIDIDLTNLSSRYPEYFI